MSKKIDTTAAYRCSEVTARLSSYQDNELAPLAREKISAHLSECESCRRELALLEQVTAGMNRLPEIDTTPNFTHLIMGKVRQKQEEKSRRFTWVTLPAVVYTVIFIVFLGLGFLANGPLTDSPLHLSPDSVQTPDVQEVHMAHLLTESQNLSLINIQDETMKLLEINAGNGE